MPITDILQGSMDLQVLKILSRRGPLHGYAIMTSIETLSGEQLRVEEGSLYPALHRLEEAGSRSVDYQKTLVDVCACMI
jgi:DNA-binding PadR family transcriptional regulator